MGGARRRFSLHPLRTFDVQFAMPAARSAAVRGDWRVRPRRQTESAASQPAASKMALATTVSSSRYTFGPRRQWLCVRNFVSDGERLALLGKAMMHMQRRELHPNPSGPNRFFAKVDDDGARYVDPLLEVLTRRCERCLRMSGVNADCVLGRTISLILPGGFIHRHTDKYFEGQPGHRAGMEHLRCNIVVRLADPTGLPIVDGASLPVAEGDLWAFFASKSPHETAPLQGSDCRIVFGFGWSVDARHVLEMPPDDWDVGS